MGCSDALEVNVKIRVRPWSGTKKIEREKKNRSAIDSKIFSDSEKDSNEKALQDEKKSYPPLSPADGTTAAMFLLFFHLPENRVFLNLDEIPAFLLTESEPELFYTFSLFGGACAPDLIRLLRLRILGTSTGALTSGL
jgi:hypothetical protein